MKRWIIGILIIAMFIPMFATNTQATLSTTHDETPQNLYVNTPVTLKTTDYRSSNGDPSTDTLTVTVTLPNSTTITIAQESFTIANGETKTFTYTYCPPISGTYTVTYDYDNAPDQTGTFTAYLPDVSTSATDMIYVNESVKIDTAIQTTIGAYNGTLDIYVNATGESPSLIDTWGIVMQNDQTLEHTVYYKATKIDTYTITYDFSADELDRTETFTSFKRPTITTNIDPTTMWQGNTTTVSYTVQGNNTFHPDLTVRAKIIRPDESYYYTDSKSLSIPSSDTLNATVSWDIKQITTGHYGVYFEETQHGLNAQTGGFDVTVNPNEIKNKPPVAFASSNTDVAFIGDTVKFTGDASDIDGIVVNYTWNFGDGNVSYEKNPQHYYNKSGKYTISLIVTDNDGGKGYSNITITVYDNKTVPVRTIYMGMPTPYFGYIILLIGAVFLVINLDSLSRTSLFHISFLDKHGDILGGLMIVFGLEEWLSNGLVQRIIGSLLGF